MNFQESKSKLTQRIEKMEDEVQLIEVGNFQKNSSTLPYKIGQLLALSVMTKMEDCIPYTSVKRLLDRT